jgi:HTH-type transcriptional regulator / antitoxin HigA
MIICRRLWLSMVDLFNTEVRLLLMLVCSNQAGRRSRTSFNIYGDLLAQHQPKAIETEAENEAAILLAEETSYPLPNIEPNKILLHLIEAQNMKQEALVGVIGSRGVVSEIVNGKRLVSKAQAKALGEYRSNNHEHSIAIKGNIDQKSDFFYQPCRSRLITKRSQTSNPLR